MGEWSEEKFQVLEWSIENISCWRNDIHDKTISIPELEYSEWHLTLSPRGINGQSEHLVVLISGDQSVSSAELSIIGSDGSVLSSQLIKGYRGGMRILEISPELKFEDIVAQNRKNEAIHGDKLTLRWRWKMKSSNESVHYKRTKIAVFDTTMKIPLKVFDDVESKNKYLAKIEFPLQDATASQMSLFAMKSVVKGSAIELVLTPTKIEEGLLVLTVVSVLSPEDTVMWTEENEHIFRNACLYWTFIYLQWRDEMPKDESYLLLRVKIIPSHYKHRSEAFSSYSKDIIMMPTSSFKLPNAMESREKLCNPVATQPGNSVTVLTEDLKNLFMNPRFSDFRLRCGNVSFAAHKNILSARSSVFQRLLTMADLSAEGCMDIRDIDEDTLRCFLVFLYSGAVEDLQGERVLKLYYAAQKYQVHTLMRECAKALKDNLSVSNVCQILSLADRHGDKQLMSGVHQFILENFSEVLGSKEWASFMNTNPDLLMKTVVHFAKRKFVGKIIFPSYTEHL